MYLWLTFAVIIQTTRSNERIKEESEPTRYQEVISLVLGFVLINMFISLFIADDADTKQHLVRALRQLLRYRPDDPMQFLANYFMHVAVGVAAVQRAYKLLSMYASVTIMIVAIIRSYNYFAFRRSSNWSLQTTAMLSVWLNLYFKPLFSFKFWFILMSCTQPRIENHLLFQFLPVILFLILQSTSRLNRGQFARNQLQKLTQSFLSTNSTPLIDRTAPYEHGADTQ